MAGKEFFLNFQSPIRSTKKPCFGAAAIIVPEGERGNNPRVIVEYFDLTGNQKCRSHFKGFLTSDSRVSWISAGDRDIHGGLWG